MSRLFGKPADGSLAQLGEHLPYKQRVIGSSPITSIPVKTGFYGEIAQLARAHGSYPWCRGFKSPSRYLGNGMARKLCRFFYIPTRGGSGPCATAGIKNAASAAEMQGMMRTGIGYDVHRLVEGRKLILGGVEIPWKKGLLGHSDADVLVHAVMDALLGAAALGDIGQHFPDTDPAYEGVSSLALLAKVGQMLGEKGFLIENLDAVIVAQEPKMRPYIESMRQNIAETLELDPECVNVKATTEEGLGFTGQGEGISAQAVCLLTSPYDWGGGRMPGGCDGCAGCGRSC